jgi:hypothetical protein
VRNRDAGLVESTRRGNFRGDHRQPAGFAAEAALRRDDNWFLHLDNRMKPSFWQRFGTVIVLGGLILLFVGLMVYGNATEEIEQGNDKFMGVPQR